MFSVKTLSTFKMQQYFICSLVILTCLVNQPFLCLRNKKRSLHDDRKKTIDSFYSDKQEYTFDNGRGKGNSFTHGGTKKNSYPLHDSNYSTHDGRKSRSYRLHDSIKNNSYILRDGGTKNNKSALVSSKRTSWVNKQAEEILAVNSTKAPGRDNDSCVNEKGKKSRSLNCFVI
jgi:hypothetical protein